MSRADEQELDEQEFRSLVESKRHNQVLASNEKILAALKEIVDESKKAPDNSLKLAVEKQTKAIYDFLQFMKETPAEVKPVESKVEFNPEIKVEANQEKVVNSVVKMSDDILEGLQALKEAVDKEEKPKEFEFIIHRGAYQLIEKITVKQV